GQFSQCRRDADCCSNKCTAGKCALGDKAWDASDYKTTPRAYRSTGGGYVSGYHGVLGTNYQDLPLPPYQQAVNQVLNSSNTRRMVPDVSIVGDSITTYFRDGSSHSCAGGSSYAAALWGGMAVLIHQENATLKQPPLGMANYALYDKFASSDKAACFADV